ncbi:MULTISPECIES: hypothetical protein [unclassified Bradyrhizobium]|nr:MULTISPECIES: hypothetical protein [unclassified Bradyrhizobium]
MAAATDLEEAVLALDAAAIVGDGSSPLPMNWRVVQAMQSSA